MNKKTKLIFKLKKKIKILKSDDKCYKYSFNTWASPLLLKGIPERNSSPIVPACVSSKAVNQNVLLEKLEKSKIFDGICRDLAHT